MMKEIAIQLGQKRKVLYFVELETYLMFRDDSLLNCVDSVFYIGKHDITRKFERTEYQAECDEYDLIRLSVYCGANNRQNRILIVVDEMNEKIISKIVENVRKVVEATSMTVDEEELIRKHVHDTDFKCVVDFYESKILCDEKNNIICMLRESIDYDASLIVNREKFDEMMTKLIVKCL